MRLAALQPFWPVGALAATFVYLAASTASAFAFDLAGIIKALEQREAAIEALAVNFSYSITSRSRINPDQYVSLARADEVLVDFASGRVRSHASGEWFSDGAKPIKSPLNATGVFDGTAARTLEGTEHLIGIISPDVGIVPMNMDPRNLATRYFDKPVSAILRQRGAASILEEERDGMRIIAIETPEREANNLFWAYRFEVCPEKSFALAKSAQTVRYPFAKSGYEFTQTLSTDFVEVESGVWLPVKILHEVYDVREEDVKSKRTPPLQYRWKITASNWIVNPTIDDSMFTIDFPSGTEVNDKTTGQVYKVASVNDSIIDQQSEFAKGWMAHGVPTTRFWLVAVNIVVAISLLFLLLHRRLQQRT